MTLQQELARTERHRLVHARSHGCQGTCSDGRYLEGCADVMQRLIDENVARRPVLPSGTLDGARRKIHQALLEDEFARQDELVFVLLAYEVLEPGEVLLLERFDDEDPAAAATWLRDLLVESGAAFEFTA
jgi:hypothetical protein